MVISREAFNVDPPRLLPVQTREAIRIEASICAMRVEREVVIEHRGLHLVLLFSSFPDGELLEMLVTAPTAAARQRGWPSSMIPRTASYLAATAICLRRSAWRECRERSGAAAVGAGRGCWF